MAILFGILALVVVVGALMTVLHKNPVTSALFLVSAFCGLAGIYLLLRAEFVAMVQVIVYAGAIMVLFLFVIMYLNLQHDIETGVQIAVRRGFGWLLAAAVGVMGFLLFRRGWAPGPELPAPAVEPGNVQAIGQLLYTRYLFPFEVTSLVLLVAMVGVIIIGKGRASGGAE